MDNEVIQLRRENARLIRERDLARFETTTLKSERNALLIKYQAEMSECVRLRRLVEAHEKN